MSLIQHCAPKMFNTCSKWELPSKVTESHLPVTNWLIGAALVIFTAMIYNFITILFKRWSEKPTTLQGQIHVPSQDTHIVESAVTFDDTTRAIPNKEILVVKAISEVELSQIVQVTEEIEIKAIDVVEAIDEVELLQVIQVTEEIEIPQEIHVKAIDEVELLQVIQVSEEIEIPQETEIHVKAIDEVELLQIEESELLRTDDTNSSTVSGSELEPESEPESEFEYESDEEAGVQHEQQQVYFCPLVFYPPVNQVQTPQFQQWQYSVPTGPVYYAPYQSYQMNTGQVYSQQQSYQPYQMNTGQVYSQQQSYQPYQMNTSQVYSQQQSPLPSYPSNTSQPAYEKPLVIEFELTSEMYYTFDRIAGSKNGRFRPPVFRSKVLPNFKEVTDPTTLCPPSHYRFTKADIESDQTFRIWIQQNNFNLDDITNRSAIKTKSNNIITKIRKCLANVVQHYSK